MYLSEPFSKWHAWCDLVMLAKFSDTEIVIRGIRINAKRGCVYVSTRDLASRWRWSRGKVLRFLHELEMEHQIVPQKSNVINCISITNYNEYQSSGTTNSTTNSTTNKEKKKETKKNKNIRSKDNNPPYIPPRGYESFDFSFVDEKFRDVFFDWLSYKNERKDKRYTETGLKTCYKKLLSCSGNDQHTARLVIENSIANNWAGFFKLKNVDYANQNSVDDRVQYRDNATKDFTEGFKLWK